MKKIRKHKCCWHLIKLFCYVCVHPQGHGIYAPYEQAEPRFDEQCCHCGIKFGELKNSKSHK